MFKWLENLLPAWLDAGLPGWLGGWYGALAALGLFLCLIENQLLLEAQNHLRFVEQTAIVEAAIKAGKTVIKGGPGYPDRIVEPLPDVTGTGTSPFGTTLERVPSKNLDVLKK